MSAARDMIEESRRPDPGIEALLEFLKRSRGFEFTGYKRASLERRFSRRMRSVGCESYGDYLDFLEVHPDELAALFDALLVNVTAFFRDPKAWQRLRETVLPELLEERGDEPIRVWSAGCASGEEAYSVAMTLAELLGKDAYRRRVRIYATDIDEAALAIARHAVYTAKQLEPVPEEIRHRYFERAGRQFAFRQDLRRNVIFGRNNLVRDAPISRLDLLVCRNTLMYFTAETQARILRRFHFALRDRAPLMLGRSEMMLSQRELFEAVDLQQRIFRRRARPVGLEGRVARPADGEPLEIPVAAGEHLSRDAALELSQQPLVIVSRAGLATFVNRAARALFDVPVDAIGRPFRDLELACRPVDLRAPVEQALRERGRVAVGEVSFTPEDGEQRKLDVTVTPLARNGEPPVGVAIAFEDVTRYVAAQQELEGNRRDLQLAYEELQSAIDELETTNEELESANEELQTTNEELETINYELRDRTGELDQVDELLEGILTSLGLAVAVLDREQRVQIWNQHAEDLWGMRRDEAVEHPFLSLDIGLPAERLAPALRAALAGSGERVRLGLEAVNRRGRSITCVMTVMPLASAEGDGRTSRGAIVVMQDVPSDDG